MVRIETEMPMNSLLPFRTIALGLRMTNRPRLVRLEADNFQEFSRAVRALGGIEWNMDYAGGRT